MTRLPLRIAWFSPLNNEAESSESFSAYTTDILLPYLRQEAEITLFHDGFEAYKDFPTFHYLSAFEHHRQNPYDVFFYQLEDSSRSNFLRIFIGIHPGVVWYHDLLYSSDGPEPILNSAWEETLKKFQNRQHEWPARERKYKRTGPLGRREVGLSFLSLFSSERDHAEYQRHIRQQLRGHDSTERPLSYYLPFPVDFSQLPKRATVENRVIGYCGSPRLESRSHKVLQALSEVSKPFQLLWLIDKSEQELATGLLNEFSIEQCELIVGRSPDKWAQLLARIDIALHPLFSVYGQPGPYLALSLSAGVPAIVTRFGAAEFLPESVAFSVEPGETEATQIREVLEDLLGGSVSREETPAKMFARENYDAAMIAQELLAVLNAERDYLAARMAEWAVLENEARGLLVTEAANYVPTSVGRSVEFLEPQKVFESQMAPIFKELGWSNDG